MGVPADPNNYPCAERIHKAFRGSTELAKWLRLAVLVTEMIAAFVAGLRILWPNLGWPGWASLLLAAIVLIGVVLHLWSRIVLSFSERCRRTAIRAYGNGIDAHRVAASLLLADEPWLAEHLANKLPTGSLDEYYESENQPGVRRVRELYAHSAFYTWKLRRVCWSIYLIAAVTFALAGFLVIYGLAVDPADSTISGRVLDLVCSIIFVILTAKAAIAAFETKQSCTECKRIMESLLSQKKEDDPSDLATDYDIEIANGITIPTPIYRRMRDDLQREWHEIRSELA